MQFRILIIIFGIAVIHNFFDFAREAVKEFTTEPQKITRQENTKKAEPKTVSPAKKEPGAIPNGFANYKWGAMRSSLPAMDMQNQMNDGRVLYKFKNFDTGLASEYLGSNKPFAAYATLTDDRLSYLLFQFRNSFSKSVLDFLTGKYGQPKRTVQQDHTSYRWDGKETVLIFVDYKREKNYSVLQVIDKITKKK